MRPRSSRAPRPPPGARPRGSPDRPPGPSRRSRCRGRCRCRGRAEAEDPAAALSREVGVGHVDAVLAHALRRTRASSPASPRALVLGERGRAWRRRTAGRIPALPRGRRRRCVVEAIALGHSRTDGQASFLADLGIGHVDAVLAHARRPVERGLLGVFLGLGLVLRPVVLARRARRNVVERGDAVVLRGRRPAPARDGGDREEEHGQGRGEHGGTGRHGSPFVGAHARQPGDRPGLNGA